MLQLANGSHRYIGSRARFLIFFFDVVAGVRIEQPDKNKPFRFPLPPRAVRYRGLTIVQPRATRLANQGYRTPSSPSLSLGVRYRSVAVSLKQRVIIRRGDRTHH